MHSTELHSKTLSEHFWLKWWQSEGQLAGGGQSDAAVGRCWTVLVVVGMVWYGYVYVYGRAKSMADLP